MRGKAYGAEMPLKNRLGESLSSSVPVVLRLWYRCRVLLRLSFRKLFRVRERDKPVQEALWAVHFEPLAPNPFDAISPAGGREHVGIGFRLPVVVTHDKIPRDRETVTTARV